MKSLRTLFILLACLLALPGCGGNSESKRKAELVVSGINSIKNAYERDPRSVMGWHAYEIKEQYDNLTENCGSD